MCCIMTIVYIHRMAFCFKNKYARIPKKQAYIPVPQILQELGIEKIKTDINFPDSEEKELFSLPLPDF